MNRSVIPTRSKKRVVSAVEIPDAPNVLSWDAPGGVVRQVHLMFPVPGVGNLFMRFKQPEKLDALIEALGRHRLDVFGVRGK